MKPTKNQPTILPIIPLSVDESFLKMRT